jgi:hypothetical protein
MDDDEKGSHRKTEAKTLKLLKPGERRWIKGGTTAEEPNPEVLLAFPFIQSAM